MSIHPKGTRIVITDRRTRVGNHPVGSGLSDLVGKAGVVTSHGSSDHLIKLDDPDFDAFGTWTFAALDLEDAPVVDDNPVDDNDLEVGDRVTLRDLHRPTGTQPVWPDRMGKVATVVTVRDNALGSTPSVDVKWDEDVNDNGLNWSMGWFQRYGTGVAEPDLTDGILLEDASTDNSEAAFKVGDRVRVVSAYLHDFGNERRNVGELVDLTKGWQPHQPGEPHHPYTVRTDAGHTVYAYKIELVDQPVVNDSDSVISALRSDLSTLTEAASEERRRLCAEIDALKNRALNWEDDSRIARKALAAATREANEYDAVVNWLLKDATDAQRFAVEIFLDGYRVGAQD